MRHQLDLFIKRLERNKSSNTVKTYTNVCGKFIEWLESNGYDSLDQDKDVYLDYIDFLKETNKPNSVKTKMASINSFVEFLYDKELISKLPFRSFKEIQEYLPVVQKKGIITLTKDQLNEMVAASNNDLYKISLIHFMFDTAMRVSEIVNAKWSDIERKDDVYVITVHGKGKGGFSKVRHVNITKETYELIRKLRQQNCSEYIFASVRTMSKVTERRVEQIISDVSKKAGIENITTHTMRKTSATTLMENGMPIEYVSKYLGHESVSTTINHYVDCDREMSSKFKEYYTKF